MSDPVTPRPVRRRRGLRALAVLLFLAVIALAAVIALSPSLRWSTRAAFSPAAAADAWRLLPADRPVVAALDVRALLDSPVARAIRPEMEAAAHSQGFDLALAERNADLLLMSSDGRGFASGAAAGPRLSPLLLPRFDARWHLVQAAGGPAVSDGSAIIRPLQPGIVAYAVSESRQDALIELEAALAGAAHASQPPLPMNGASVLVVVTPDAALRNRMVMSVPRQAAFYISGVRRLEARATAGDTLDATVRVTMQTEDGAAATAGALTQLDQVLTTGLASFLAPFLGKDAAILEKIPPFDVAREGADVVITLSATPEHLRALLAEIPQGR